MVSGNVITVGIASAYLLVVLGVGEYARRKTRLNHEDYFMASRTFGTVVLLFALLATTMTAFIMIGIPGLAYNAGIAAYGWGSIFFLGFPIMIATVGYRLYLTGRKFGHVTPGDLFNHRYDSKHLGAGVGVIMIFWTVPYMLLGTIGGGIAFEGLTDGLVPYWAGSLAVILVVLLYVNSGGMRGTGWTNTFQGMFFMALLWLVLVAVAVRLGGFSAATEATVEAAPELLDRQGPPQFSTTMWFSMAVVFLINSVMNPHLFQRILPGMSIETLRRMVALFPLSLILVWAPPPILGFWGRGQVPGLEGAEADNILPILVDSLFGPVVSGLILAGLLAAIMSSIDGQTLSLSNLITDDFLDVYAGLTDDRQVFYGRVFVGIVLLIVYGLTLLQPGAIVEIGELAFSGFATLFFPLMIGFYWRRANAAAAWAGIVWGFVGLWIFTLGWLPTFGFMPIVPTLAVQISLVLIVPYFTPQPPVERVEAYFDLFEGIW